MSIRSLIERHWKVACVIFGCWTFLAPLFTPQTYVASLRSPTPPTWGQALLASMVLRYAHPTEEHQFAAMEKMQRQSRIARKNKSTQDAAGFRACRFF